MKWFSLLIVVLFVACSTETSPFDALEDAVASDPTNENVTALIDAYDAWLAEHPAIDDERFEVLTKANAVAGKHLRYTSQLKLLKTLILEYPEDPAKLDHIIEFTKIQESLRRNTANQILVQLIAENFSGDPRAEALYVKIPGDAVPADTLLADLGRNMFDKETLRVNQQLAREYVSACEGYALIDPDNPIVVDNLHKAAETARTIGAIDKSLELYEWVLEEYPNNKRTPQALFLKAFTYDSNLKDFEKAGLYYTEFLDKYPDDQFAPSARFLLDNLGKDDEQLLQSLQEKAKENEPTE